MQIENDTLASAFSIPGGEYGVNENDRCIESLSPMTCYYACQFRSGTHLCAMPEMPTAELIIFVFIVNNNGGI
jgi:hypothetical protein